MLTCFVVLATITSCMGDLYLHMPRGSNNRLDEANRDRANANRLFDSQNNNRGGYNVGSVYYTQGSTLYSQWTNQHSCGADSNDCELIIQYMCDDWLRDGTTTNRIPTNPSDCYEENCDQDTEFGRMESYEWYYNCSARSRNKGLFTAGQNLKGDGATYTRQNPNANRYGYECAEERDYYPYWYPSPWKDIAILTNKPTRCAEYQDNSENVKGRYYCDPPAAAYEAMQETNTKGWIPINETECKNKYFLDENENELWYQWRKAPSHDLPKPECSQNWWSRDNHLGSVEGGYMSMFNWTMPTDWTHEQCAFRMRYNITTMEYNAWEDESSVNVGSVDSASNADVNDPDRDPARISIWEEYDMTYDEVEPSFNRDTNNNEASLTESREYVLKDNPKVDIFGSLLTGSNVGQAKLQLNINTNQFGRTFQDRSHRWALRPNSGDCNGMVTHNLQVRGKRGNVVQTYPGMEYDFVPEALNVQDGECVHIQWTGSNTNPNNNAGQGRQGTDRHNMVLLHNPVYDERQGANDLTTVGQFGASFPNDITETNFLGLSNTDEQHLAILDNYHMGGELSELDDAGTYFDLTPKKITRQGIYHYLCTRNNNFSNRGQKGKIVVSATASTYGTVGWEGGAVVASSGVAVVVPVGSLTAATTVTINEVDQESTEYDKKVKSDFIEVFIDTSTTFDIEIPYSRGFTFLGKSVLYHPDHGMRDVTDNTWETVKGVKYSRGVATFEAEAEGVYVVANTGADPVAAVFLTLLGIVVLLTTMWCLKYRMGMFEWMCEAPCADACFCSPSGPVKRATAK